MGFIVVVVLVVVLVVVVVVVVEEGIVEVGAVKVEVGAVKVGFVVIAGEEEGNNAGILAVPEEAFGATPVVAGEEAVDVIMPGVAAKDAAAPVVLKVVLLVAVKPPSLPVLSLPTLLFESTSTPPVDAPLPPVFGRGGLAAVGSAGAEGAEEGAAVKREADDAGGVEEKVAEEKVEEEKVVGEKVVGEKVVEEKVLALDGFAVASSVRLRSRSRFWAGWKVKVKVEAREDGGLNPGTGTREGLAAGLGRSGSELNCLTRGSVDAAGFVNEKELVHATAPKGEAEGRGTVD